MRGTVHSRCSGVALVCSRQELWSGKHHAGVLQQATPLLVSLGVLGWSAACPHTARPSHPPLLPHCLLPPCRARLIASSRASSPTQQMADAPATPAAAAAAAPAAAAPSAAAAAAPFLADEWAHALPGPEKGALLLAHPQMFGTNQVRDPR